MDFVYLSGIAISRLGLSLTEFFELSPAEFYTAIIDQMEREFVAMDIHLQAVWETTRMQMVTQVNSNPYRKQSIKEPREIYELPWDKARKKAALTKTQSVDEMKSVIMGIHSQNRKARGGK